MLDTTDAVRYYELKSKFTKPSSSTRVSDIVKECYADLMKRANHEVPPIEYPKSENDVILLLKENGIKKNSGSFCDYSSAKLILFKGEMIPTQDYRKIMNWVTKYIGV